jgi:hypothetical protein
MEVAMPRTETLPLKGRYLLSGAQNVRRVTND